MNSVMNIMVRVVATQAEAALARVRGEQAAVTAGVVAANRQPPLGRQHLSSLLKLGNQLQWTGRMLIYNFTLPIVAAGAAAAKWSMDQEKAMVHVKKVYGDTTSATKYFNKHQEALQAVMAKHPEVTNAAQAATATFNDELKALDRTFTALSDRYGIQKKDVNEIAGAWAGAGVSGLALAKVVDTTMRAIVIGDMDAHKATEALIQIQGQYGLSAGQLSKTLDQLNSVENATGATMEDLIDSFARSAGVARAAGVSTRQLAALTAALVPAAGSATNAGNALKTIFSRLVAPTKQAIDTLGMMHIQVDKLSWNSMTAVDRLKLLAQKFESLPKSQQNFASSILASRWQLNKFDILMGELVNKNGYYQKALNSTTSQTQEYRNAQRELNAVLKSNPQTMKRMWVMLQNAMVNIIQPLIPFIVYLAQKIADMAQAFANLNPFVSKTILFFLVFLALVGPILRYVGALKSLVAILGMSYLIAGRALGLFTRELILADGSTMIARKGLLQFIAAFTVKPIWFFATNLASAFGWMLSRVSFYMTAMIFQAVGGTAMAMAGMTRILASQVVIGAAAGMWNLLKGVFASGAATVLGVEETFNAASVASTIGTEKAKAAATVAGNAMTVASDIATTSERSGAWALFYSYITALQEAFWAASHSIEAAAGTALATIDSGIATARSAAWDALYAYLLAIQQAYWAASYSLEAGASASMLALEASGFAAREAMWNAFMDWHLGLYQAYLAAWWGLDSGNSARRLAIEAATDAEIIAAQVVTNETVVAINAAGAAESAGIWAVWSGRIIGIFKGLVKVIPAILMGLVSFAVDAIVAVGSALVSVPGLIIASIVGLLYAFRNQIGQFFQSILGTSQSGANAVSGIFDNLGNAIMHVFNMLPQSVQNAMLAVVAVVRAAAIAVYNWFSYINPWAHHSPSLVENVTKGMRAVNQQFATLAGIKKYTSAAYAEIAKFGKATAGLGVTAIDVNAKKDRKTLKDAGAEKALASYNRLVAILKRLTPLLDQYDAKLKAQQAVVDKWQNKLDQANDKLDVQQKKLDALTKTLNGYQDKLSAAQSSLSDYANAPLKGMAAMNEQIWQNSYAQTKLNYQMMQMEQTTGTLDDIKGKLQDIAGAQELLRGEQSDLRAAGAGGDILGQYDKQLKSLDSQKDAYQKSADALGAMQAQLDALQREADRLDLVKAMKFDLLQHKIDLAANQMKELSFDEIMAGITKSQADITKYTALVDKATKAQQAQQAIVDKMTAARDKIQAKLDKENKTLDSIQKKYDAINQTIQDINSAISSVTSNADAINQAADAKKKHKGTKGAGAGGGLDQTQQQFANSKGGFPEPGGSGIPIRKNWASQAGDIDKFTQQIAAQTGTLFDKINPFKALKDKAVQFWHWIEDQTKNIAGNVVGWFKKAFAGFDFGGGDGFGKVIDGFKATGVFITNVIRDVMKFVKAAWDLLGPEVIKIAKGIWQGLKDIWKDVGPELVKFGPLLKDIGKSFQTVWKIAKPILALWALKWLAFGKILLSIIGEVIGPILSHLGQFLKGVIKIIRGVVEIVAGILSGDWATAWDGVVDIVVGTFGAIWNVIAGAVQLIWDIIKGFVKGVVGFIRWMADIVVHHSIIPDMMNAIIDCFMWLLDIVKFVWKKFVQPLVKLFAKMFSLIIPAVKFGFRLIWNSFKIFITVVKWLWDNVLAPIWHLFTKIWNGFILPAIKLWWAGFQMELQIFKTVATWIWNNVLAPLWHVFTKVWNNYILPAVKLWWSGLKSEWNALKTAGKWIWDHVLKPVWDMFKKVWNKFIGPFMRRMWDGLKNEWNGLKKAGQWIWDHVLQPVWNFFKNVWTKYVGPALKEWWSRIKNAWNNLKTAGKWIWDNVLNPVFSKVKSVWTDHIKPSLTGWWSGIKNAWNTLKGLGKWFHDNVMSPVFDKVKSVWTSIRDWLKNNKDMLLSPIKGIVNALIWPINKVIDGLNKVSDILPGISWHINDIPTLHAAGTDVLGSPRRRANRGFKTTGARAIVGEGKPNWPEYVIPTDPTHRRRAVSLLADAASKIGMAPGGDPSDVQRISKKTKLTDGIPMFGLGGILSSAWGGVKDLAGSVAKKLKSLGKHAIGLIMNPLINSGESLIKKAGYPPAEAPPLSLLEKLKGWVSDSDKDLSKYVSASQFTGNAGKALKFARSWVGTPYKLGGFSKAGVDCSGFMSAIGNVYSGHPWNYFRGTTAGVPWGPKWQPGFSAEGFTIGSTKKYPGSNYGHMAGTLNGVNVESRGGVGVIVGSGARGWNDPGFDQVYHLAQGGIVRARRGGVLARVGEGNYDEAVTPLPRNWKNGDNLGAEKHYHFYGDLSFPNITSPNDAQTFLDNLETLAKD